MKSTFALMLIIFLAINPFAQNLEIRGEVKDSEGMSLSFVNIYLLNTAEGSMTNEKGEFSFKTKKRNQQILVASMVGYETYKKEINLQEDQSYNYSIQLEEAEIQLKSVIVKASSYSSVKEKGVVVSQRDVYTTPGGAADLFQSLKTMPGMTQVSESAELYVRGGDPIETVTMIDQSTIYHPYSFESAYGGIFSNISTSAIKGMYFSSGGFSAKYGNVLSGVLDIETVDEPVGELYSFGLSLANVSFNMDLPLVENQFGIRFGARKSFTKPIFWLNGESDRLTLHPTSEQLTGSVVYKYSQTGRLKLFILTGRDEQGVKVDRAEYSGTFTGNSTTFLAGLQVTDIISKNLLMKSSLSLNAYDNTWLLGLLDLKKKDYNYKLRSDFELTLSSSFKLNTGAEAEYRTSQYIGTVPVNDFDISPDGEKEIINSKLGGERFGAYAELEKGNIFGVEQFSLTAGARVDYFPTLNLHWIDPRFNLGVKLDDFTTVAFGTGIFHQLPDPRLFVPTDGNPNLKGMRASHYIVSFNRNLGDESICRIEAYYKNYKNLPLENDSLNYDNNGYGFAKGVDFILKGRGPFKIDGWISYGVISTKRKWMDYEELTSSSYDVTHNFILVAKYMIGQAWQIGVSFKYATGRPYTPVLGANYMEAVDVYEPVYGLDNSSRYNNYKRLDLRVTYLDRIFNKLQFVSYVEMLNILNDNNIFGYSYDADYSNRRDIKSYFGRRMIVFGFMLSF